MDTVHQQCSEVTSHLNGLLLGVLNLKRCTQEVESRGFGQTNWFFADHGNDFLRMDLMKGVETCNQGGYTSRNYKRVDKFDMRATSFRG